ncbi:MAG: YfhO family protein [Cyanobacteria bacterium SZAS LIN-2]|nr:YfhO family protein [Cyanobacteria bacterium SZAS LIN-2]
MNEKIRRHWPSVLVISAFCLATVVQFWPALSGSATISKVQQLAEWDSLFDAQKSGQSMLMDPSLVYLMIPYYLFKAGLLHLGQMPLWNPYSGLGCPLLADPQALALSPLHLPLIFSPGLTAYNQVLVLEILILALSTFALARSLKLGIIASAFAMTAMGFCPYERWYLELLGNGYCFIPLVFCVLLRLREEVSAGKIWLAALGCALMLLSAHPELSFFSIGIASLALLLYALVNKSLRKTFLALCATGALTFMLAAPMLLPFLEYLRNSDSYKFGSGAPAVVRWQTLIFDLLQPGFGGASPTLGPSALALIPLAFAAVKKQRSIVYIFCGLTVFCLFLTGKIFPLNLLLARPPLTYLVVNYAFPAALLMTAMLAAFGLDTALKNKETDPPLALPVPLIGLSVALALTVASFPLIVKALHLPLISANFDMCLPDFAFNRNDVLRYSIFAVITGVAILAHWLKPVRKTALFLTVAVCIGQSAEIITSLKSMPRRPRFAYEEKTVVPQLRSATSAPSGQQRFIATGTHLFRPNSNVIFGLSDLRTHNPLFPKRYITFLQACGAHLDEFNQTFDSPLSPLLATAGVRAVLSQTPVVSERDLTAISASQPEPISVRVSPTIEALWTPLQYDRGQGFFGNLQFKSSEGTTAGPIDLTYNIALYDGKGNVLWFSDGTKFTAAAADQKPSLIAVPTPAVKNDHLLVGLQVYDNNTKRWLAPPLEKAAQNPAAQKNAFILATLRESQSGAGESDYKLVYESPARIRIYENDKALPRAFAVDKAVMVASGDEALAALKDPNFDPRKTVILEKTGGAEIDLSKPATESSQPASLKITAASENKVTIEAALTSSGYVVLNDIYYPGWKCLVDGRETTIERANYLMRAVPVSSGKHEIVFEYKPLSFPLGLILFALASLIGLLIALKVINVTGKNRHQGTDINERKADPGAQ